jgi:glucose-1-phosphate thymidylyltransferase
MPEALKIVIPMAGLGTRMRPHTWSKPKPLVALAGKTVLDHVLSQFNSLPEVETAKYVFIISPQGWQIKTYMDKNYPRRKCTYIVQEEMRGQSHAIHLARKYLKGPMLMTFSDTLIETDLSELGKETADGVAWVKPVPDPRRFGVAETDPSGTITRLVEKPQDRKNNLALVGFYYFRDSQALVEAIEEQMRQGTMLKNEYFLADAINILLQRGAKMRVQPVETWLDAGIPQALLETNRHLLAKGQDNSAQAIHPGVVIIPPVFIHESAKVKRSVIGPDVSIDQDCEIVDSIIRNTIIGEGASIHQVFLEDSLVGDRVHLENRPWVMNIGDDSWAAF